MADNVGYTPGVGATVAADEVGGALYQRMKIAVGADGVNDGDVSSANPLPTTQPLYATILDETNTPILYYGEAAIGSVTSDPVWRIRQMDITGTMTITTWAHGNANFDNVWDDRADPGEITYS